MNLTTYGMTTYISGWISLSNSAEKGGAIYVSQNTNDGVFCQGADREINQAECFIQTLGSYSQITSTYFTFINTFFTNNTAHQSGSDIYGGLLDQCTINQNAELYMFVLIPMQIAEPFTYIQAGKSMDLITSKLLHKLNRLSTTVNMRGHTLNTFLITSQK